MQLFLLGLLFFPAFATAAEFSDVPTSHPYFPAIEYVRAQGIVEGYSDNTYRADSTINRAEFTKLLVMAKFSSGTIESCMTNIAVLFSDTPHDAWFTPYICTAFRNGIVNGYPDSSFRPSNSISYAEAAKMIKETFGVEWVTSGDCTADYDRWMETSGSLDDAGNPYWWQKFTCALTAIDVLPPTYRTPEQLLTRGEMAEMIYRLR